MPAKSKKQQRFFGMVHAVQKGDMKAPSKQIADAAGSISSTDAGHFASTKHKNLPEKVGYLLGKIAADVVMNSRKSNPVYGTMDRLIYDDAELDPPNKGKHLKSWQTIADYMTASAPSQLNTAKVFSGRTDPSKLINQVDKHKDYDTLIERLNGIRSLVSQDYSMLPAAYAEQVPAQYHPYANTVLLNQNAPGALIHELGHSVDLSRRNDNESNIRRWLRWSLKPTLMQEHSAWRKGRKAYQAGAAADPDIDTPDAKEEYSKAMRSYNSRKYPAYGTYVGGTAGALGGGIAGGIGGLLLEDKLLGNSVSGRHPMLQLGVILGAGLGGGAGILGGAVGGKLWSKLRSTANEIKSQKQLEKARKDPRLDEIRQRLLKLRSSRLPKQTIDNGADMKAAAYAAWDDGRFDKVTKALGKVKVPKIKSPETEESKVDMKPKQASVAEVIEYLGGLTAKAAGCGGGGMKKKKKKATKAAGCGGGGMKKKKKKATKAAGLSPAVSQALTAGGIGAGIGGIGGALLPPAQPDENGEGGGSRTRSAVLGALLGGGASAGASGIKSYMDNAASSSALDSMKREYAKVAPMINKAKDAVVTGAKDMYASGKPQVMDILKKTFTR